LKPNQITFMSRNNRVLLTRILREFNLFSSCTVGLI
jgi:hypothetical protein